MLIPAGDQDATAHLLRSELINKWTRVRGATPTNTSFISTLASNYNTTPNVILKYGALIPEIYICWYAPEIDQREYVRFSPSKIDETLLNASSILLCHSLSPTEDSIFLIAE